MNTFAALAVPTRLGIVELLADHGRMTATEISDSFSISAPAISQHLTVLCDAKLVLVEKAGRNRIYRLNPTALTELEEWASGLIQQWDSRLDSLDAFLQKK